MGLRSPAHQMHHRSSACPPCDRPFPFTSLVGCPRRPGCAGFVSLCMCFNSLTATSAKLVRATEKTDAELLPTSTLKGLERLVTGILPSASQNFPSSERAKDCPIFWHQRPKTGVSGGTFSPMAPRVASAVCSSWSGRLWLSCCCRGEGQEEYAACCRSVNLHNDALQRSVRCVRA